MQKNHSDSQSSRLYRKMRWTNLGKDPGLPNEPFWKIDRIVSAMIVLSYIAFAILTGDAVNVFVIVIFSFPPILCIWFPEIIGKYVGWILSPSIPITKPTHKWIVWFVGWLWLFLPLIYGVILYWGMVKGDITMEELNQL